jgi:hypothetical protein
VQRASILAGVSVVCGVTAGKLVYLWLNQAYPVGACERPIGPGPHTLECVIDLTNTYQAHARVAFAVALAFGLVAAVAGILLLRVGVRGAQLLLRRSLGG